jgi:hypothetical protein
VEAGLLAGMQVLPAAPAALQVVMVPEGASHPGATAVLHSLSQFAPEQWGLPPWDH